MLFNPDFQPFDPQLVERVSTRLEFTNRRFDDPGGVLIECDYVELDDRTIIHLSGDARSISVDHISGAALRAAMLIRDLLGTTQRMFDDDNSFDLTLSNGSTLEELEAAIDNAQAS